MKRPITGPVVRGESADGYDEIPRECITGDYQSWHQHYPGVRLAVGRIVGGDPMGQRPAHGVQRPRSRPLYRAETIATVVCIALAIAVALGIVGLWFGVI